MGCYDFQLPPTHPTPPHPHTDARPFPAPPAHTCTPFPRAPPPAPAATLRCTTVRTSRCSCW